jgi:hypothetical protein
MSILSAIWPWRTKKGRTFESVDKIGRRRVLCVAGGSPVTGGIEVQHNPQFGTTSRWSRCPECEYKVRVTGLKSHTRLTVHNAPCRK